MESNTIMTIIGGIVILVFIIIAIIIRMKTNPSAYDKEMAQNFLNKLSDTFYKKIVEIVNNIDLFSYSSVEELETSILTQIYDAVWDVVQKELEEQSQKDILTALSLKVINKDFVIQFVDKIIDNKSIMVNLTNEWVVSHIEESSKESCKEDEALQKKFSDSNEYNENFDVKDLPPAQEIVPTEDELAELNPPSEEDINYSPEADDSVELIEENFTIDSNGRKRDKLTGRFVK